MAEYVGGESMAVAIGDPITFVNKVDDAISRKSAINTVMSLYGKCDTLSMDDYRDMLIGALEVLPPTHPDIIRCKECRHKPYPSDNYDYRNRDRGFEIIFPDDSRCPCRCDDEYYSHIPDDDWFCGNAERRTDGM